MSDVNIETGYDAASIAVKSAIHMDPLNLIRGGLLKIVDKNSNLIPLEPSYSQNRFLHVIEVMQGRKKPIRMHILKARQVYMSTIVEAMFFAIASQVENVTGMVIADDEEGSVYLFDKQRKMQDELKREWPFLVERTKKNSEAKMEWAGKRSWIMTETANNLKAGRKFTLRLVHNSESGFWRDYETLTTGLYSSVPDTLDTIVVDESTANGMAGGFYNGVMECYRPNGTWDEELGCWVAPSGWLLLFIAWYEHEEYRRVLAGGVMETVDGIHFGSDKDRIQFLEDEERLRAVILDHHGKQATKAGVTVELAAMKQLVQEHLNWRRYKIKNACKGDVKIFDQEYPDSVETAFLASGRPAINMSIVTKNLKTSKFTPPIARGDLDWVNPYKFDGRTLYGPKVINGVCTNRDQLAVRWRDNSTGKWLIWEHPVPGYEDLYCSGYDVAEGLEQGDFDSGFMLRRPVNAQDYLRVVASIQTHISPELYGEEQVKMALYYHRACLGVEINPGGHGNTVMKTVWPMYGKLYFRDEYSKGYPQSTDRVGWSTMENTRKQLVDDLDKYLRQEWLLVPDIRFWTEARTFVYDAKGRPAAQRKKIDPTVKVYDDTIFGLGIALQVHLWLPAPTQLKIPVTGWRKRLLKKPQTGAMGV